MDRKNLTARAAGCARFRLAVSLIATTVIALLPPAVARGQDSDSGATTSSREWSYSSRGPSRGQGRRSDANNSWWDAGAWSASVSAGPAWFGGDGMSGSADFAAEARVARELTDEVYLLGSYTFALAQTKVSDGLGGSGDEETHDLHVFALGLGLRLEATPEVQFFVEPRVGVLFGSDADAAPVGMLSGGVELFVTEGMAVRFAVTGFVTDSSIETDGPDAHLDSGVMGTLGIAFEF